MILCHIRFLFRSLERTNHSVSLFFRSVHSHMRTKNLAKLRNDDKFSEEKKRSAIIFGPELKERKQKENGDASIILPFPCHLILMNYFLIVQV